MDGSEIVPAMSKRFMMTSSLVVLPFIALCYRSSVVRIKQGDLVMVLALL